MSLTKWAIATRSDSDLAAVVTWEWGAWKSMYIIMTKVTVYITVIVASVVLERKRMYDKVPMLIVIAEIYFTQCIL